MSQLFKYHLNKIGFYPPSARLWKTGLSPLALCLFMAMPSHAEVWFDPSMITGDVKDVADLSRFEQAQQPVGDYQVFIRINNNEVAKRNVRFVAQDDASIATAGALTQVQDIRDNTGLVACLTKKDLSQLGVNVAAITALKSVPEEQCISPGRYIPDAWSAFHFQKMQLDLSIPQAAMQKSARGWIAPEMWDEGVNALLLNYRITGNESRNASVSSREHFLMLNSGLNLGAWRLRDNSTWQMSESASGHQQRWQHLNTYVERAIIPWRSELTAGDGSTNGDVFDTVSFRGVQLATDDNMYPDSLRGFAPVIRGVAHGNAQVTVRQNGNIIYQTNVSPGAFAINDLYPTYSGGDLDVVIKAASGTTQHFVVPYSSVSVLQREGYVRYGVTAGRYRGNSLQYADPAFLQGTLLWGLPHGVTAYGGMQYAQRYQAAAIGGGLNLGSWGAASLDITQANSTLVDGSRHSGQSVRFLYSRVFSALGTTVQLAGYRYSTRGFHTLQETTLRGMSGWLNPHDSDKQERSGVDDWDDHYDLAQNKRERIQVNLSQRLGTIGSVSLVGSRQSYWNSGQSDSSIQAAFNSTVGRVNYSLGYSYSRRASASRPESVIALSLSFPLSALWSHESSQTPLWATFSTSRDNLGDMTTQTALNGSALKEHNLNWNVAQAYSSHKGNSASAGVEYEGSKGSGSLNYSYGRDYRQLSWGASGAAVLHAGGLTLGQNSGDTSILVAAPGAGNVPVEGVAGIHTDSRGFALVPYAQVYRENRISLDESGLDERTEIDSAVAHVVPTRGALVKTTFAAHTGVRAIFTLEHNGKPLPFGTEVTYHDSSSITGDDGQVYLSGLALSGVINASWGPGPNQTCTVNYRLPEAANHVALYQTKQICR